MGMPLNMAENKKYIKQKPWSSKKQYTDGSIANIENGQTKMNGRSATSWKLERRTADLEKPRQRQDDV